MDKKTLLAYSMLLATVVSQNVHCRFFREVERYFEQAERNMRKMFTKIEKREFKFKQVKNTVNITEKNGQAIITIELGKDIKEFNADIKTKKAGFKIDQITIQTEQPKQQDIIISIVGNYLALEQHTQTLRQDTQDAKTITDAEATQDQAKQKTEKIEKYSTSYQSYSSQVGKTLSKKLDVEKTELEYDEKTGILTVVIPHVQEEKKLGKKIDVKIKKENTKQQEKTAQEIKEPIRPFALRQAQDQGGPAQGRQIDSDLEKVLKS